MRYHYRHILCQIAFDANNETANGNNYWYCNNLKTKSKTESFYFHKSQLSSIINFIVNNVAESAFLSGHVVFDFHAKYTSKKLEFCEVNNIVKVCFSHFDTKLWPKDNIYKFFLFYDLGEPDPLHRRIRFEHSVTFAHGNLTTQFCTCLLIYLFQQKNINYIVLF